MRIIPTLAFALVAAASLSAQTPTVIPAPADVAAPPKDATKTASGLATQVLQPGTGKDRPRADEIVTVHYTGWTTDGKMFDSSVIARHAGHLSVEPRDRRVDRRRAADGHWREAPPLDSRSARLQRQAGRPKGMLVFDVELLDMPTRAPADVKAPPADAKRTASGLAYKVLKPGTGKVQPKATSQVMVHYTGWTTDGKMFDSSVVRGQPATFPLNGVIPGWTEGLQLMVEGEKTRFWIPDTLAYKGQPDGPQGTLVFDVELLRVD